MSTNLDALIRDALSVESIDAEDLLEPRLRATGHHRAAQPWTAVAAAAAVVLAVAGAGVAVSHHRGSKDRSTGFTTRSFTYLGPVTRETYAAGGALLLQPPGTAVAQVSATRAFHDLCSGAEATPSCASTEAEIVLALLTTPTTGRVRADGTTKPSVDNVLSYVVTWRNVPCPDYGGAATTGTSAAPRLPVACTETVAVNAHTGRLNAGNYYG